MPEYKHIGSWEQPDLLKLPWSLYHRHVLCRAQWLQQMCWWRTPPSVFGCLWFCPRFEVNHSDFDRQFPQWQMGGCACKQHHYHWPWSPVLWKGFRMLRAMGHRCVSVCMCVCVYLWVCLSCVSVCASGGRRRRVQGRGWWRWARNACISWGNKNRTSGLTRHKKGLHLPYWLLPLSNHVLYSFLENKRKSGFSGQCST